MSKENYIDLLNKLVQVRGNSKGEESPEEDDLLGKMDVIWFRLTDKERAEIQALPTQSLLKDK